MSFQKILIDQILPFFSNREWALIVGILILAIYALCVTPKSAAAILKCLFVPKLLVIFIAGYIYLTVCVWLLNKIELWNMSLIKETVLYILSSVFFVGKSVNIDKNSHLFRKQVFGNMKMTTIITYLVNLYSFSFWIEFFLLIIVSFFTTIYVYTEKKTDEQSTIVHPFSKKVLFLIFLVYFVGLIIWLVTNWREIFTTHSILALLLPIMLGIMFIPYMYGIALYSKYELIFCRLRVLSENIGQKYNYRKRRNLILKTCGLNLCRVKNFNHKFHQYAVGDYKEFVSFVKVAADSTTKEDNSKYPN